MAATRCWTPLLTRIHTRKSPRSTALCNRLSGVYNPFGHLAESKARERALELAKVKPGQHVLEVAVGTGLALVHVVRSNPDGRNVGMDISQGMLPKAERRLRKAGLSNYELSIGSALATEEKVNAFDALLNRCMLDLMDEHDWLGKDNQEENRA